MESDNDHIKQLEKRIEALIKKQNDFSSEIYMLKLELNKIKNSVSHSSTSSQNKKHPVSSYNVNDSYTSTQNIEVEKHAAPKDFHHQDKKGLHADAKNINKKKSLEKFIGENLMNKIGIAITIIGLAIGTKYSIEHELISPLTRIILGYLFSISLLILGIRLRSKYENYSAVLVSGAMAAKYFITFSAYNYFDLIPQTVAFILMVIFTIFTVLAALSYNLQLIAHIGLVGAYAIPFLLSNDSGRVEILFSYITIINAGILYLSFKKYWKQLFYVSFILTWIIYFAWYIPEYVANLKFEDNFALALSFSSVFFITFYITFLSYKLLKNEIFNKVDIVLLLTNSFVYYGIGYVILDIAKYDQLLGLFTLANAIIHFVVAYTVFKQKLADKNLFHVIIGLVLVFITTAIPVQLEGSWVTLLWAGQAAILFYIGKSKRIGFYELLSYPIIILAFFSLAQDWMVNYTPIYYSTDEKMIQIFNVNFLSSLLFVGAFSFMQYINHKHMDINHSYPKISHIASYLIPSILIFSIYYSFRMEIAQYWNQALVDSKISFTPEGETYATYHKDYNLSKFKTIWIFNYTFVFLSVLSLLNIFRIKSKQLAHSLLVINGIIIISFLIGGIIVLGELRDSYVEQTLAQFYKRDFFCVGIRYVSIILLALLVISSLKLQQKFPFKQHIYSYFELFIHGIILTILSNELITWLSINNAEVAYKTGLSILWGAYSLIMIVIGIIQKKQYVRIASMAIFAVTLIKLFYYDLSNLDTLQKTIVFVSLGVFLLIISFLYNKYKNIINE